MSTGYGKVQRGILDVLDSVNVWLDADEIATLIWEEPATPARTSAVRRGMNRLIDDGLVRRQRFGRAMMAKPVLVQHISKRGTVSATWQTPPAGWTWHYANSLDERGVRRRSYRSQHHA